MEISHFYLVCGITKATGVWKSGKGQIGLEVGWKGILLVMAILGCIMVGYGWDGWDRRET